MVLQRWQFDWHNIHFDRSTGWALAVAVNAVLLLLLTLPMRPQGVVNAPAEPARPIDWIELKPAPPVPPAPPPPTAPQKSRSVISEVLRSHAPPVEQAQLVAQPEAIISEGDPQPAMAESLPGATGTMQPAGEAEASIDYDFAPLPPYPRSELQRGVEGRVLLRVEVDAAGRVLRVEIEESSGHRRLDRAAQQQVARHWRFRPASKDGQPVAGWVRVPIEFSLRG